MPWSGTKKLEGKCYRIRDDGDGRRQMLEAGDQWAIEKGLDETFVERFSHYVGIAGNWFVRRDVAYGELFPAVNADGMPADGYERLSEPAAVDRLFATLGPLAEWVVFLEERLNDCELAIQYQLGGIPQIRARLDKLRQEGAAVADEAKREARTRIEMIVDKILSLLTEREALLARLHAEEGLNWGGMDCCTEISGWSREALLAKYLDEIA